MVVVEWEEADEETESGKTTIAGLGRVKLLRDGGNGSWRLEPIRAGRADGVNGVSARVINPSGNRIL